MVNKIVAAVDLSAISKNVVSLAEQWAKLFHAEVVFVTVMEPILPMTIYGAAEFPSPQDMSKERLKNTKAQMVTLLKNVKVPHKFFIKSGNPSSEIRKFAKSQKASLIILGNEGKNAISRFLLGSVSDSVARESRCPVLVLKGKLTKVTRIAVPLDGTPGSLMALELAKVYAKVLKAKICPLSIVEEEFVPAFYGIDLKPHYHQMIKKRKDDLTTWLKGIAPKQLEPALVRIGRPVNDLPVLVKTKKAHLVILSSHAHVGKTETVVGRVSSRLLHQAPSSVLMVSPQGLKYRPIH